MQTSGIPTWYELLIGSSSFASSILISTLYCTGTISFLRVWVAWLCITGKPKTAFLTKKVESLRRYQSFCVHSSLPDSTMVHALAQGWAQGARVTEPEIFHQAHKTVPQRLASGFMGDCSPRGLAIGNILSKLILYFVLAYALCATSYQIIYIYIY